MIQPPPPRKKLSLAKKVAISIPLILFLIAVGWRQWRIWSFPEVGESFDKQAFLEPYLEIEDENAFQVYKMAQLKEIPLLRMHEQQWKNIQKSYLNGDTANWVTRKWVEDNKNYLKEVRTATDWERGYDVRPDQLTIISPIPLTQDMQTYIRLQSVEVSQQTAAGELEKAWEGYRAMFNVSRQIRHNCIIAGLVGFSCHAMVTEPFAYYLASSELTADDLRKVQMELKEIYSRMPPPSVNLKSEYWLQWNAVRSDLRRLGVVSVPLNEEELTRRTFDLLWMNLLSQCDVPKYERAELVQIIHEPSINKIGMGPLLPRITLDVFQDSIDDTDSSYLKLQEAVSRLTVGKFAIVQSFPPITKFLEASDQDQARCSAVLLLVALHLYHREQGEFPESLEPLVPDYMESLPWDPFGKGEPLRYRREGEHAVIYSLGQDGIDDGGKKIPEDQWPPVNPWMEGDLRFEVYAPGTKAPLFKMEPVRAGRY